ncbi:HNH endonuclease [Kitasatospora sp. NPDC048365]|uniref:HNH endonuclease n=1 Tax=Kitasatospora sp. NPDC048365 TaxID=3364050 RepID=UPI003714A07A
MSTNRPAILASVKRAVRKRCGFGCVFCGIPFYEYDHMEPWSDVQEHDPDNLTLLCSNHHSEKGRGLISLEQIRAANRRPRNVLAGNSAPYVLRYEGLASRVSIGTNEFFQVLGEKECSDTLVLNGEPVFRLRTEGANLLITARLMDPSGGDALWIEDNELCYSSGHWDVEFIADRLVIRSAMREIIVKVVFNPPGGISIERGFFSHEGLSVRVTPRGIEHQDSRSSIGGNVKAGSFRRGIDLWDPDHYPGPRTAVVGLLLGRAG